VSTWTFGEARGAWSLSPSRPSSYDWELISRRAPCVQQEIVDQEQQPRSSDDQSKKELLMRFSTLRYMHVIEEALQTV